MQIANLYEVTGNLRAATKWFNILVTRVPTDPGVLSRLGQIFNKDDDESQAFHYHFESYRFYPVNLDVISWLGVWYVKSELYEKAIEFFRAGIADSAPRSQVEAHGHVVLPENGKLPEGSRAVRDDSQGAPRKFGVLALLGCHLQGPWRRVRPVPNAAGEARENALRGDDRQRGRWSAYSSGGHGH